MSKTFGYIMLAGLLGSAILALALMIWVFARASSTSVTDNTKKAPVVEPTRKVSMWHSEPASFRLVDGRVSQAAPTLAGTASNGAELEAVAALTFGLIGGSSLAVEDLYVLCG